MGELRKLMPEATIDTSILETGWWGSRKRETHQEAVARAELVEKRFIQTLQRCEVLVAVIHADFKRLLLTQMLRGITDAAALGPMRNTELPKSITTERNGNWTGSTAFRIFPAS